MDIDVNPTCYSQQLAAMLQHEVELQQRQQQNFERLKDSLGLHNMSE